MKDQFVPYQIAKALKEKGFDEQCFAWSSSDELGPECVFDTEQYGNNPFMTCKNSELEKFIAIPLYQQAVAFFQTKDIHIEIYTNHSGYGWILTKVNGTGIKDIEDSIFFETNNQALDKGIIEALKLI